MKVLTRSLSESVVIDNHILVTIKSIEEDRATLSIESLRKAFPYREEVIRVDRQGLNDSAVIEPVFLR